MSLARPWSNIAANPNRAVLAEPEVIGGYPSLLDAGGGEHGQRAETLADGSDQGLADL